MTNHQFDDPLKELEAALAVEPSPAFAAQVRTRVAESSRPMAWPFWQRRAAAAIVAVAVTGVAMWRLNHVAVPAPTETSVAAVLRSPLGPGATPVAVTAETPEAKAASTAPAGPHVRVSVAPEVLVPPDQAIALNRLMAGLRERAEAARTTSPPRFVVIEALPKIEVVQIEPIKIDPLVPNAPSSGGKEKDR